MTEWPICLPNQVIKVNELGDTAIVCCWSRKDRFLQEIIKAATVEELKRVVAIGNLYTQERGIDFLIRNLLANPNITKIIIGGRDRSGAGEALFELFSTAYLEYSIESGYSVAEFPKVKIRNDIEYRAVQELIDSVDVVRTVTSKASEVASLINSPSQGYCRKIKKIFLPPTEIPTRVSTNEHAHVIRGNSIPEVYLDMLYEIMTFGRIDDTHYDQRQRELLDVMTVIEGGEPTPDILPEFIPFSVEDLAAYDLQLNSPDMDAAVTYLYGNRIRSYFGVDQFKGAGDKLVTESVCRSAVISLWDPKREGAGKISGSPCLNHLWFRIREIDNNKKALHMTAVIRSNDMFTGWPENAFGLRMLQERMRQYILKMRGDFQDDKGLLLGDTVILSESAHLYEDCWDPARAVIDKHRATVKEVWDKKGNWIIDSYAGEITASLVAPDGFEITSFTGHSANKIRRNIIKQNLISDLGHAMFIGEQLYKAEVELINRQEQR